MTRKKTTEEFIADAIAKHGDIFIYNKVRYDGAKKKVVIGCTKHGEWQALPNDHLNGSGCPECGIENRSDKRRKSEQRVRQEIFDVHGHTYLYKSVLGYKNKDSKIEVYCRKHGWFSQTVANHVGNRQGCPSCCTTGYQITQPGYLYVLADTDALTKVGISNNSVDRRCSNVSKTSGRAFAVHTRFFSQDGRIPSNVETLILRELRSTHNQPEQKFDGHSECFYNVDLPSLITRIEFLIKEQTQALQASQEA